MQYQVMKTCVLYFSRTGNIKRMAEAISDSIKAPAFDIASSEPSIVENYEMLIIGTALVVLTPYIQKTHAYVRGFFS